MVGAALRRWLGGRGYDVVLANGPAHALETLREGQAQVLLTDLCMPEIDGFDLIRLARKEHPHLPIIAFSGGAGGRVKSAGPLLETAALFGASAVLTKPFSVEELERALEIAMVDTQKKGGDSP